MIDKKEIDKIYNQNKNKNKEKSTANIEDAYKEEIEFAYAELKKAAQRGDRVFFITNLKFKQDKDRLEPTFRHLVIAEVFKKYGFKYYSVFNTIYLVIGK